MKTYWLTGKTEPEIGQMQFSALSLEDKDLDEQSNKRDDDMLSDTSSLYAPVLIEDVEKIQQNRLSPRNNEKIWNKQRENRNNKLNTDKENPADAKGKDVEEKVINIPINVSPSLSLVPLEKSLPDIKNSGESVIRNNLEASSGKPTKRKPRISKTCSVL